MLKKYNPRPFMHPLASLVSKTNWNKLIGSGGGTSSRAMGLCLGRPDESRNGLRLF